MTKENLKDLLVLLKLYPYEEYIDDIKIDSSVKNSKYEFYEEVNIHVFLKIPNECPVCHSHDVKRVRTKVKENIIHSFSTIVEKEKFGTKGLINLTYYAMVCKQCGETFTNSDVLTTITNKVTDYTVIGVLRSLSDLGKTYKNVADTFGISATLVQKLFDQHVEVDYVPLPKVISIDEFYKKSSSQKYACTILDYLNYKVITVLQSRRKEYLVNFLQSRPKEELENVEFFIIDMYYVYKDVFGALLPNAYCCVDSYHVISNMIKKLDAVRLRLMKHMDRSSYNYMLLKKHFRFILMNKDDLKNENRKVWYNHRCDVIHYDQLKSDIKQINENLGHFIDLIDEYREFNKEYVGEPLDVVEQKLNSLIFKFKEKKKPDPITKKVDHQYPSEMYEIGNSLTRWKAEILNSFILVTNDNGEVMRQSNAKIESLNGKIKSNISSSMGIRNFQRLGKRIMYSINFKPEFIKYEQINLNSKAYYLNNHRKGKTYRKNNFKKDKNKK